MIARPSLPVVLYVFITLPINIITFNNGQYDEPPLTLLFVITLGLVINALLAYLAIRESIRNMNQEVSLFYVIPIVALLLLISFDYVTPLRADSLSGLKLDGTLVKSSDFVFDALIIAVSILVFAGLLLFNERKLNKKLYIGFCNVTLVFSVSLLLSSIFDSENRISWRTLFSNVMTTESRVQLNPVPLEGAIRPNVYHLIFDAFGSYFFERALSESDRPHLLKDFILYDDARTNYDHTTPSIASVRLGRMNGLEESFSDFTDSSKNDGIDSVLKQAGYRISNYNENLGWVSSSADYYYTNEFATADFLSSRSSKDLLLFDFWIMRLLPSFFQAFYYQDGSGMFSKLNTESTPSLNVVEGENQRTVASLFLARKLIDDENLRNQYNEYVFMHTYLTHGPYVINSDCSWNSKPKLSDDPSKYYLPQTICALNVLQELVASLIEQDKYETSMIIVHADHGTWEVGPVERSNPSRLAALTNNLRLVPAQYVENQSKPLLLVKTPRDRESTNHKIEANNSRVRTDGRPVSLIDIMPSILGAVDIEFASLALEGVNIFGNHVEKRPWRLFQMGFKQVIDPTSRVTSTLGSNTPSLVQRRYKIYPSGVFARDVTYRGKW